MGRVATLATAVLLASALAAPTRRRRPDQGRHRRLRAAERRPELGSPQLGPAREHHPRLQRLRSPRRARPQDGQGGPEPRRVVARSGRYDLGGEAPEGREVPRRHAVRREGRQGHLRARAEPREQAHRPRQPRQDQERRGRGRPHRAVQDGRPLPALRRAPHRPGDAVGEGDPGEGPRVDAGQPGGHRALQAPEVEQEAGAPPRAERRLLGPEARLQVRAHPDHPGAGHPDRRADLGRRRHHQGGAPRPDGRDQQVRARPGPRRRRSCARRSSSSTRRAARARTPSRTSACGRPPTWPSTSTRSSSTSSTASATARRRRSIPWPSATTRASSPTRRTSPRPRSSSPTPASRTGSRSASLRTQPVVEPGLIQTSDAIVADLAKAGIRTKQRMVGESGPFTNLVRDNKADPMFEWSWGYYSIFDADAILYDVMTCNQPYSYYCNKALDDLVIQGRSTLDTKKRPGDLHQGPEAPQGGRRRTSTSGGCAASGASATGSTTRRRGTRSTGCSS